MSEEREVFKDAVLSDDGVYRYKLTRRWSAEKPPITFVMLNPSTADAVIDDPTIRRCMGYAEREGCGGIVVVNLYAYRTKSPDALFDAKAGGIDVVGPENDLHLQVVLNDAVANQGLVVAAWGSHGKVARADDVMAMAVNILGVGNMKALATTKDGLPGHPLYLKKGAALRPFPPIPTDPAHWTTTWDSKVAHLEVPFIEDDNNLITGYGHQDKETFAAALNEYDGQVEERDPDTTVDDVAHGYAVMMTEETFTITLDGAPVTADTLGSFPVTMAWSR